MTMTTRTEADVTKLRELRESLGMTQMQVALAAGISLPTYQRLENPRVKPETAHAIARVLKVDAREIDELRDSLDGGGLRHGPGRR